MMQQQQQHSDSSSSSKKRRKGKAARVEHAPPEVVVIDDHEGEEGEVLYQRAQYPLGFVLGGGGGGQEEEEEKGCTGTHVGALPPAAAQGGWRHSSSSKKPPGEEEEEVLLLQGDTYSPAHPPAWLANMPPTGGFHEEVKAFADFMSPTQGEKRMREEVIHRITSVISSLWPSALVNVFGSSASGLCLPLSDVDMGVVGASGGSPIYMLAAAIRRRGMHHNIETIAKARVPIIKLVDSETNCQVDISFGTANGAINTAIVKKFCAEAEEIRPLALVLKYYLGQMGLNEPYTGGIGSYTLLLMIISYLQLHRPEGPQGNDLGELLKGFLLLYGRDFNYHRTGISVRNGGCYYQKARRGWGHPEQPWLLSVEDPGDPENDTGRSSFGIMEVRACFLNAYRALTSRSELFTSCPSFLARILLRDRRLEQHRLTIRDLAARLNRPSSADRKRTRDQRDQHSRPDDDRSHYRRRDHDQDDHSYHRADPRRSSYSTRPPPRWGGDAEGGDYRAPRRF